MGEASAARLCVVVMGPSGVGKTTTARMIAERLAWTFAEADEFHSKANIEKMSAGVPLTDEDRWPWLASIRDWVSSEARSGRCSIITCSALKRSYRDLLRGAEARVRFLELLATPELVESRMSKREGHYMPVSLLASQFAALEELSEDEDGVKVSVAADPITVADAAMSALGLTAPAVPVAAAR